jgi:hypothetical protein
MTRPKHRKIQPRLWSFYLAGATLAVFFFLGAAPGGQEMPNNEGVLIGLLFKTWEQKEQIGAAIQVSDREIQRSEEVFQEAEKRMSIAVETFNRQAAWDAREPLKKARAERDKLKQARARLDLAMARAEASHAAARDALLSAQGPGTASPILGLAYVFSGKAKVLRTGRKEVELYGTRPIFLEPGDELMTMDADGAQVLALDGRAVVLLGERTRLKLEGDGPKEQALRLVQGKIHCAIHNGDDFAAMLRDNVWHFEANQELKEAIARTQEQIDGWKDKKLTVRTVGACCSADSAKFTVELVSRGGTDFTILEGSAAVGDAECAQQVLAGEGFQVTVKRAGISKPQKIGEIENWWEK